MRASANTECSPRDRFDHAFSGLEDIRSALFPAEVERLVRRPSHQPRRQIPGAVARTCLQLLTIGTGAAVLRWLEELAPLRRSPPNWRHLARNLLTGIPAGVLVTGIERPLALALGQRLQRTRRGLLAHIPSQPAQEVVAMCLLDYGLFLWHRAVHQSTLLWPLHRDHHADRYMDISTAARFSVAEVAGGSVIRLLQTWVFGIPPRAYKRWQSLMVASLLFHHSNLRLPPRLERWLAKLIVTPRLHSLHHSVVDDERATNFSSCLTLWDRLHGTFRYDERPVRVGLPLREPVRSRLDPPAAGA